MARHHTFDDVVDDELDFVAARVFRPFNGLCHDSHVLDSRGVRISSSGSLDTVAVRVHSCLGWEDGARGSFEEVVQHCLHEGSRIRSQSWEDVRLESVGPSDDFAWTLFSSDLADSSPDLWGERISRVKSKLRSY